MSGTSAAMKRLESFRFEGLTYAHEGNDPILKSCDFAFPPGEILWLKSSEGAGKTSLLQILAGLLIPQSGSYYMNEENVLDMSFEEFLPYRLRIGFTFDYGGLINNRTLEDNLLLPLVYHKLMSEADAKLRVRGWIKRFEMEKFAKERPAHVPGRLRKLTVLLRGLVAYPDLCLLDDPSVGLGESTSALFRDLILELRSEGYLKQVIICCHDNKFMSQLPFRVVHLDGGQLYLGSEEEKKVVNL